MEKYSPNLEKVSDPGTTQTAPAAQSAIDKFVLDHFSPDKASPAIGVDHNSNNWQTDSTTLTIRPGTAADKSNDNLDLHALFKQNPIYPGQDNDYIENEWKKGATDSPTSKQEKLASAKMNESVNSLLSDTDRHALNKAQEAILKGEPKALSDVLEQYKNDPEKLKSFVGELNKNLENHNVDLHLKVQGETVSLSGMTGGGDAEVTFDMDKGQTSATFGTRGRASFDGSVSKDPETVMKRMGNQAVEAIEKSGN